jgi:probable rRNA maturation factor
VNIRIKNNLRKRRLPTAALLKRLSKVLRSLGLPDAELSVLFIGDRAMRTLNRTWRGKDSTTDVLSFPLREGRFPNIQPEMLGDIVISLPVAARQAVEAGHPLSVELEQLLVHGLLHLLGYDHEQGLVEARRMKRKEQRLLKWLAA